MHARDSSHFGRVDALRHTLRLPFRVRDRGVGVVVSVARRPSGGRGRGGFAFAFLRRLPLPRMAPTACTRASRMNGVTTNASAPRRSDLGARIGRQPSEVTASL